MKKECIFIIGGDGFCGWPTSLQFASQGYEVVIVDNLSRRKIDIDQGTNSLTDIANINDRIAFGQKLVGDLRFENCDVAKEYDKFVDLLKHFQPTTIVHFGEQRAAPYSMVNSKTRRYTVENNTVGTHNILSAIVETNREIHLVHLGTMGVYGYSKEFGEIPEGYLNVEITQTSANTDILYPANPGSIYHMTKCLDQLLFQFYFKNWGVQITDLHQGIVWGVETDLTKQHKALTNRFDYDGLYGTVLNRFLSQATNGVPLTVYGSGGQARAFINISDTAKCLELAVLNPPQTDKVRIMNQVAEVRTVKELAELVASKTGVSINNVKNPRKELAENDLEVRNDGLTSLGFQPILLNDGLMDDVRFLASKNTKNFNQSIILNSAVW